MDRCRCAEYSEAVKNMRFYIVGTHRPEKIENYDRSKFVTVWIKKGIDYWDMRFCKPRAWLVGEDERAHKEMSQETWAQRQMWCGPYMTPYIASRPEETLQNL